MAWNAFLASAFGLVCAASPAVAGQGRPATTPAAPLPAVETLERDLEAWAPFAPVPSDPLELFAHVFNGLPPVANVYPTENYYYFWFFQNGIRYAGNIRLSVRDRDSGIIHFTCFRHASPWLEAGDSRDLVLGAAQGVGVERISPLAYRVSFRGKTVVFALNDLSTHVPPATALGENESFIGPVFDESGLRFFLTFDRGVRTFLYVLDETEPPRESFVHAPASERIEIGQRTGFAFYRDDRRPRRLLIGVFEGNAIQNNFFDGPFDQLPDNFIHDDRLRDAILIGSPELRGKIDRLGVLEDGERRVAIAPYRFYTAAEDLREVADCASAKRDSAGYYGCFGEAAQ